MKNRACQEEPETKVNFGFLFDLVNYFIMTLSLLLWRCLNFTDVCGNYEYGWKLNNCYQLLCHMIFLSMTATNAVEKPFSVIYSESKVVLLF